MNTTPCETCGLVISECVCSVGGNPDSTPAELAAFRHERGLDQPLGPDAAKHFWDELRANMSPEEVAGLRRLAEIGLNERR